MADKYQDYQYPDGLAEPFPRLAHPDYWHVDPGDRAVSAPDAQSHGQRVTSEVSAGDAAIDLVHSDGSRLQTAPVHDHTAVRNCGIAEEYLHLAGHRQGAGGRGQAGNHFAAGGWAQASGVNGQRLIPYSGMVFVQAGAVVVENGR